MRDFLPSRITVVSVVIAFASAAIAPSAFDSCMNPMMALVVVTPQITPAFTKLPEIALTKPAPNKMISSGWLNCSKNFHHQGLLFLAVSSFAPNSAKRCLICTLFKPVSKSVSKSAIASTISKECQVLGCPSGSPSADIV